MDANLEELDVHSQVLQNTLSSVSLGNKAQGDQPAADCCVICLDNLADPCLAKPCLHRNFDFLCLVSWLQEKATCPLCKSGVREVLYGPSGSEGAQQQWTASFTLAEQPVERPTTGERWTSPPFPVPQQQQHDRRYYHCPRPAGSNGPPLEDDALKGRRDIYRLQLYSLHVGSNRLSRYRELTPALFASQPALVSKARKWIRRELQVFEYLSAPAPATDQTDTAADGTTNNSGKAGNIRGPNSSRVAGETTGLPRRRHGRITNAEYLLEYVVAILKTVDTQASSGAAEDMLADFLGRRHARLFLHELRAWLRSPFESLAEFDRHVQYDEGGDEDGSRCDDDYEEDKDEEAAREGEETPPRRASGVAESRGTAMPTDRREKLRGHAEARKPWRQPASHDGAHVGRVRKRHGKSLGRHRAVT